MSRKVVDCRDYPSDKGCTLMMSGEEDELVEAAALHAVSAHGHEDDAELRVWLRENMRDEATV